MKQKNMQLLMVVVVGALLIQLAGLYDFRTLFSTAGGQVTPQGVGGACPDTGTVDMSFYGQRSYADPTTGVKTGVMGTFSVYKSGSIVPYTTAISTTTSAGSTSADLACGETGAFVIVNSTSGAGGYYPQKFALGQLPYAPATAVMTKDLEQISAITLYGYNTSATGTQKATPLKQKLAAGTTVQNIKLEIVPDTQEVIRLPMVAVKWNSVVGGVETDASANSTLSINEAGWSVASCSLGGTALDGYDDCYVANFNVENANSKILPLVVTSGSAFGQINATIAVLDRGFYTATTGDILFEGYSNAATGARPTYSSTAGAYVINFNHDTVDG